MSKTIEAKIEDLETSKKYWMKKYHQLFGEELNTNQSLEITGVLDQFQSDKVEELFNEPSEYKQQLYKKIELNSKDLYFSDSSINIVQSENSIIIQNSDNFNKHRYISINEKNLDFSRKPTKNVISLDDNYVYTVKMNGKVTGDIKLLLFVISYSKVEKLEVENLEVNQEKTISPLSEANSLRIAFRVVGSGTAEINAVEIYRKRKIGFLSNTSLREIGFDQPNKISELKIACIFDEFTMECFKGTGKLITFTPDNWKAILTINRPHILMVESAWVGNRGSWIRKVGYYDENNIKELKELLLWCKDNLIPTVFWNKEDPVHYDRFIGTAKYFDYVFTTDNNSVQNYKDELNHDRVYSMPFAAQPKVHNPVKIVSKRENKACFAGSYYASKFKERQMDIDRLFDAALDYGIDIYDRNFGKNNPDFRFPEKYQSYIKGKLEVDEIQRAYKGYKVMVNINSVKDSPTMFSRRVFEGIASYTPVVSSYSLGMNNMFGDIVTSSDNFVELKEAYGFLINDEKYYHQKALRGLRLVLKEHTYTERLYYILGKVGISISSKYPKVSVISIIRSREEFDRLLKMYNQQVYQNRELIILLDIFEGYVDILNDYNNSDIKIYLLNYVNNYNRVYEIADGDFISNFSSNNFYGKHYLEDLILAKQYTNAEIIGKRSYYYFDTERLELIEYNSDQEFQYTEDMKIDRCIINSNMFKGKKVNELIDEIKNQASLKNYFSLGNRLFSTDKFNFIEKGNENTIDIEVIKEVEF